MASKQTAVQYLAMEILEEYRIDQLMCGYYSKDQVMFAFEQAIERALEIEKQQIVETYNEGALDGLQLGEQYYNYVFNS
jgi:hypothetical protein